jgi:hypothetical protein
MIISGGGGGEGGRKGTANLPLSPSEIGERENFSKSLSLDTPPLSPHAHKISLSKCKINFFL